MAALSKRCALSERDAAALRAASDGQQRRSQGERGEARRLLAVERWARLCALLQARQATVTAAEAVEAAAAVTSSRGHGAPLVHGSAPTSTATDDWVPVLDVFTSSALSPSEEALMRRVIAARVAPAPSILYTRRPL